MNRIHSTSVFTLYVTVPAAALTMDVSRKHGIVRVSPLTINPVTHNGYKKNDFEIPATRKCQSVMNVLKDDSITSPLFDTNWASIV
jgi:hypothetical protein